MQNSSTSFGLNFSQVAWVVPDIIASEKYFRNVHGISHFAKMENLRSEELEGRYYGNPDNYVFHLYMAYSGGIMLELIQPISGECIFAEYLRKNPNGGVQHIAYSVLSDELTDCVQETTSKGYPIVQSLNLPVANVAFFDTRKEIGVMTEIIGVTEAGLEFVEKLKSVAI